MTTAAAPRFVLDASYRRPGDGPVVVAGSPLVVLRLGPPGVRIVRAIESGVPLPDGHTALTDRLVDIGAVHPVLPPPLALADLTVVVPAHGELPSFTSTRWRTVVVDDASPVPLVDARPGVEVHRQTRNGGPAAARTAGLAAVTTELVAFVDCDVECTDDDIASLAAAFSDPRVALVAPRVRPTPAAGRRARYEVDRSPLDLGAAPARIAAQTRVAYVPAALVVCRTSALTSVGGFDPALRYGEDVDLVWRLHEAGWRCRYEPSIVVHHRTRGDLRGWLRQRYRYGTSAGPLALRHPGALAPVRTSGWSAAVWTSAAVGHPVAAVAVAAGTAAALSRKLPDLPDREAWRLTITGHLWTGRLLAETWVRAWWPLAIAAALVSRRGRHWLGCAIAVQGFQSVRRGRASGAAERLVLRLLDDGAYGLGVWVGAWRSCSIGALAPRLTGWPPRQRPASAR